MKRKHWITLIAGIALVLGVYAVPAITQQPAAQPAAAAQRPYQVAVIDVMQVLRAHPDFTIKQAALQEDINKTEADFTAKQRAIEEQKKQLDESQLSPNSPQYQQAFDALARQVAQFEADVRAQHRRFALRSSEIMYETYQDIKGTVERVCRASGIAQVTDYREFTVNPADPQSVADDMDQRLVWFDPQLNITQAIIVQIRTAYTNRTGQQPPPIQTPATAAASAPGTPVQR